MHANTYPCSASMAARATVNALGSATLATRAVVSAGPTPASSSNRLPVSLGATPSRDHSVEVHFLSRRTSLRMADAIDQTGAASDPSADTRWEAALATAQAAGRPLLFGLRLWAAVCLALYVAFWLELDNAYWAGTSAAVVSLPTLGASVRKATFRMIGTVVGAVAIVALTACFPQSRIGFLMGLAVWGAACGLMATLLRNFASYA